MTAKTLLLIRNSRGENSRGENKNLRSHWR